MVSIFAFTVGASPVPYTIEYFDGASATLSTTEAHSALHSVYIDTGVTPGARGRIRFAMPEGTTLDDIDTISWEYFLVAGYPPHVDLYLDTDGEGGYDDCLTFEYANNDLTLHGSEDPPTYGALTGNWYTTFSDDGEGPAVVNDAAIAWSNSAPPPSNLFLHSLAEWKEGIQSGEHYIDASTSVIYIQVEMDAWILQCQAYIDDIEINGVLYRFENRLSLSGDARHPITSISVSPDTLDFDEIVLGKFHEFNEPPTPDLIVSNEGETDILLTVELMEDDGFFAGCLELDGATYSAFGAVNVPEGTSKDIDVDLDVPRDAKAGTHTAVLVFWAEETP